MYFFCFSAFIFRRMLGAPVFIKALQTHHFLVFFQNFQTKIWRFFELKQIFGDRTELVFCISIAMERSMDRFIFFFGQTYTKVFVIANPGNGFAAPFMAQKSIFMDSFKSLMAC